MINHLPKRDPLFKKSLWALILLSALFCRQVTARQTMEGIVFSPNDSGVLISIPFSPQVPKEFLIYNIIDDDKIILVTEFLNSVPVAELSSNIQRPVTHVQAHCDSTKGYTFLQTLFYLEREVPYKYRWNDNHFEIELIWQKPEITEISRAYLLDIISEAAKDATTTISFIFDPVPKDKSISLSADKKKIFIFFYNCEVPEDLQLQDKPDVIENIRIVQGNRNAPNPFARITISTSQAMNIQQETNENRILLAIERETLPIIASTTKTIESAGSTAKTNSDNNAVSMQKTKKHKKWTYIGIGSGVVVGGTVLGILLGKKDDKGPSDNNGIPDIDVELPD